MKPTLSRLCPASAASGVLGRLWLPALAAALAVAPGCSLTKARPDPTRFYVLATATGAPGSAAPRAGALSIGLPKVEIPAYLKTQAMTAVGGAELRAVGDARWAEPLAEGVARGLREALRGQPSVRRVVTYPAPHDEIPDVELFVRIEACEGLIGDDGSASVRFVAEWSVRSTAPGGKVLAAGRFAPISGVWDGSDAGVLAKALGGAVAGLAAEIAGSLPTDGVPPRVR